MFAVIASVDTIIMFSAVKPCMIFYDCLILRQLEVHTLQIYICGLRIRSYGKIELNLG